MDSPSKNTGVGCHSLLQGIFPTQGSNPHLLHCRKILYWWYTKPIPRWEALKFWKVVRLERSAYGAKWRRNLGRICVTSQTERQTDRLASFSIPHYTFSFCAYLPPLTHSKSWGDHCTSGFHVWIRLFICFSASRLWLRQIGVSVREDTRTKKNCLIRKSFIIIAAFSQTWP